MCHVAVMLQTLEMFGESVLTGGPASFSTHFSSQDYPQIGDSHGYSISTDGVDPFPSGFLAHLGHEIKGH